MNPSRIALRLLLVLPMLFAARATTAQVPAPPDGSCSARSERGKSWLFREICL